MRLDARIAKLSAAAEAKAQTIAAARDAAFERWFRAATAAWSSPAAAASARRNPSLRAEAREHLERARSVGTIYYERGAEVLRTALLAGHHAEAHVTRVLAWCRATWPVDSLHPHAPWELSYRRIFTLDEEPPTVFMLAAAAARARREAVPLDHRKERQDQQIDDEDVWLRGMISAHGAAAYAFARGGAAGTEALRAWLEDWYAAPDGGRMAAQQAKQTAARIAPGLAGEVERLRRAVPAEGEPAVLADLTTRGLSDEGADLLLDYAGARTDAVAALWQAIEAEWR